MAKCLPSYQMQAHKRANFGTLGQTARRRLQNDNDIKIIIQGANSATGIGKSTLAIELCRFIDSGEWSASEKAFIHPQEYLDSYLDYPEGSALLLDEIGAGADSRRAMSSDNVELSQGWQMLRARNIATVATLPSTNMLDHRMLELADYWILVKSRGIAQPYEIRVNDFNGKVARNPLPGEEHIKFPDLPDGDEDKRYLDNIKDEKVRGGGMETMKKAEHRKKLKQAKEKAEKETRNKYLKTFYENTDMSQNDIASLDDIELSRRRIGQIVREDS